MNEEELLEHCKAIREHIREVYDYDDFGVIVAAGAIERDLTEIEGIAHEDKKT